MTERDLISLADICNVISGKTHEAAKAEDGVLAGDNPAFEFHPPLGT
jgi:hypothetical protein